jgi:uncharacterized repeat protein (TIGR01451 family)
VTVDFSTAGVEATSGDDFLPNSGTVIFNPGETAQAATVQVVGDTTFEPAETFNVILSNPNANATIADGTGVGTIANDDPAPTADLGVTKTAGAGPFTAGQTATFTITVNNAGPGSATNVTVTDILPGGTSFVSATPSAGSCSGTTTVTCNVGTLANGGNATITLAVQLNAPGPVTNTATGTSDMTDPTPAVGAATITVNPAAALAPIPTLSEWMLMALASALATIAALKVKR